jgi:hypothetical protein
MNMTIDEKLAEFREIVRLADLEIQRQEELREDTYKRIDALLEQKNAIVNE